MANIKQPTEEQQKRWFAFAQNYNAAKQKQQQRQSFRSADNYQGTGTVAGLGRRFDQTPTAPSAVQPGSVRWEAPDQETALYQRNLNAFLSGSMNAPKVNTANSEYRMGSPASVAQYGDYLKQHAERGKGNALKYGEWFDKAVQPKADEAKRAFIQKNMDSLSPQEMAKAIDSGLQATDEQRVMAAQATGDQKYLGYGNEAWRKYTNEESMQRDYDYGHYLPSEESKDEPIRDSYWGYTPETLEGWKKAIYGRMDSERAQYQKYQDSIYESDALDEFGNPMKFVKTPDFIEDWEERQQLFDKGAMSGWYSEFIAERREKGQTGAAPDSPEAFQWFANRYGPVYDIKSPGGAAYYLPDDTHRAQRMDDPENRVSGYMSYIDRIDAEL